MNQLVHINLKNGCASATVKNPVIHNLKRLAREIKDSTSFVISSGEYKGVYIVDYKTRGIFKEC